MIRVTVKGDSDKMKKALNRISDSDVFSDLDHYGAMGVQALSRATPVDSGLAAASWSYKVIRSKARPGIEWRNSNSEGRTPIVILIQYGHATRGGGYVPGYDFINPAIQPIFDRITDDVWKRVKNG